MNKPETTNRNNGNNMLIAQSHIAMRIKRKKSKKVKLFHAKTRQTNRAHKFRHFISR